MAELPRDAFDLHAVIVEAATQSALLIASPDLPENPKFGGRRKHWVPRSWVHDDSEVYEKGHTGTLLLLKWAAEKQGWL